jgi:hypothetical protein
MKTPIFVGPLSEKERQRLRKGLRSKDAFTMRRAQILLASSEGERAPKIALNLGSRMRFANGSRCHKRLQREGIRLPARQVFAPQEKNPRGLRRAKRRGFEGDAPPISEGVRARVEPVDPADGRRCRLRGGAHREERVSGQTIRATLSRVLGIRWMRAKRWRSVGSPPPTPCTKEKRLAKLATG